VPVPEKAQTSRRFVIALRAFPSVPPAYTLLTFRARASHDIETRHESIIDKKLLRLWVYGDQGARKYFYGSDCILCQSPWVNPQTKNWQ
jgi:hypothetical protein